MLKKLNTYRILIVLLVAGFASCSSAPPVYYANSPITTVQIPTQKQVGAAIISASRFHEQWTISKVRTGEMKGILRYGQHTAMVSIPYDANKFSIIYQGSDNFSYDKEDKTIHPHYNSWVKKLESRINEEIQYQVQLSE